MELAGKRSAASEVYLAEVEETPLHTEGGTVWPSETANRRIAGLRVAVAGRIGFAQTDCPDRQEELVDNAIAASDQGETADWLFPTPHPCSNPRIFDPALQAMTQETLTAMAQEGLDGLRRLDNSGEYSASLVRRRIRISIANSSGLNQHYEKTHLSVTYSGFWTGSGNPLKIAVAHESCRGLGQTRLLVGTIADRFAWAQNLATVRPGKRPVVFSGRAFAQLSTGLQAALNGRLVDMGVSPFIGKLGRPLFDPALTLHDDPLMDWAPGSRPWDDEGTPCARVPLIEAGTLAGFCLDLRSAIHLGKRSTGSAVRSNFAGSPMPAYHNMVVDPGAISFDRMVRGVRYGLLVDDIGGDSTESVNGGFSLEVRTGYLIDRGEIVGRVVNTGIAGNLFERLRQVPALGDHLSWSPGGYFPDIHLEDVDVVVG